MNNFNGANQLLMSSKSYFDYESRFDAVYVNILFTLASVKLALGQKLKAKLYIDEANDILSKASKKHLWVLTVLRWQICMKRLVKEKMQYLYWNVNYRI